MSQTEVAEQPKGFEGQYFDLGNTDILGYLAEGAAGLEFGRFVVLGTDPDRQVKLPAVAGDITDAKKNAGVALRDHTRENELGGTAKYDEGESVSVMKKGRVYVKMNGAFTPASVVHVGFQGGEEGQFFAANSADRDILSGARILNSGADGELAILDLSLV